jgi:hypothetical protein
LFQRVVEILVLTYTLKALRHPNPFLSSLPVYSGHSCPLFDLDYQASQLFQDQHQPQRRRTGVSALHLIIAFYPLLWLGYVKGCKVYFTSFSFQ